MTKMERASLFNQTLIKEELILPVDYIKQEPEEYEVEPEVATASHSDCIKEDADECETQPTGNLFCLKEEPEEVTESQTTVTLTHAKQEEEAEQQPYSELLTSKSELNDFDDSLMHTLENNDSYLFDSDVYSEFKYESRCIQIKYKSVVKKTKENRVKFFKCFDCNLEFINVRHLKDHLSSHYITKNRIYCMECGKTYRNIYDLIFHVDIHRDKFLEMEPEFDSDVTLNLYAKIQPLKEIRESKPVKKYNDKCFKCNNFTDLNNLKNHLSRCNVPFKCQKCNTKPFQNGNDFLIHMESHTIRKPFQCYKCALVFHFLSPFKKHLKCHEESDFHRCKLCYEEFKFSNSLIYHYAFIHFSKQFICVYCGKLLSSEKSLAKHKRTFHGNKREIELEESKEKVIRNLTKKRLKKKSTIKLVPIRVKKIFKCNNCEEKFEKVKDLDLHKKNHVKKPVKTYSRKEVC